MIVKFKLLRIHKLSMKFLVSTYTNRDEMIIIQYNLCLAMVMVILNSRQIITINTFFYFMKYTIVSFISK